MIIFYSVEDQNLNKDHSNEVEEFPETAMKFKGFGNGFPREINCKIFEIRNVKKSITH